MKRTYTYIIGAAFMILTPIFLWAGLGGQQTPDLTDDGRVDYADLSILYSQWGTSGSTIVNGGAPPPPVNYDPLQGKPFPRLSAFTWGGAVPWYAARFDHLNNGQSSVQELNQIKTFNPDITYTVTKDIQKGLDNNSLPDEWKVKTSTGQICTIYGGSTFHNYTDYAPQLSTYGNKRYNEWVPEYYASIIDLNVFDGWATDGLWEKFYGGAPCDTDIDLDRNGVNDYTEHGTTWVNSTLRDAAIKTIQNIRAYLGPNKLWIVNSGGPHDFGASDSNGFIHEHLTGIYNFSWTKNRYKLWRDTSVEPLVIISNGDTIGGSPMSPSRNDFQRMRYLLGFALLNDAYFDFTDYQAAGEHYWVEYYDEYDSNLGYPLGEGQESSSGAWVRFFDNGLVVINGLDSGDVTVRASEITSLDPVAGRTYYRFAGGQDLAINGSQAMNNGQEVTDSNPLVLKNRSTNPTVSDAVILFYQPTTIVSDIIIDNWQSGTSPGSRSPGDDEGNTLTGFIQEEGSCEDGVAYYTVRCALRQNRGTYHSPPYAYASGGSNAQGMFTPNIGIAGTYDVYEWHGSVINGSSMATNVTYTINYAGGSENKTVDQSQNIGQWNKLGTYSFNAGQNGNVTIQAQGAQGTVMADAIRFVYQP